jgi:glycerophosphoryl diester phosphodiesterase
MFGRALVFSCILFSCAKKQENETIKILGHAATGLNMLNSVYHDNSKEAVEFALSIEGCNGVEIDLQLSKDGELWLYHDEKLETETNGFGCISNLTSAEISEITYTSFHAEHLAKLSSLDFTQFKGKELILDLRQWNFCESTYVPIQQVIDQLLELNLSNPTDFKVICLVEYSTWIEPLHSNGFSVFYPLYSMEEFPEMETLFPMIDGYVVKNPDWNENEIQNIKNSSKKVYIFEVRSPKGIRKALRKAPDGLITDDIRNTLIEMY